MEGEKKEPESLGARAVAKLGPPNVIDTIWEWDQDLSRILALVLVPCRTSVCTVLRTKVNIWTTCTKETLASVFYDGQHMVTTSAPLLPPQRHA
jgi:hypothetical protein